MVLSLQCIDPAVERQDAHLINLEAILFSVGLSECYQIIIDEDRHFQFGSKLMRKIRILVKQLSQRVLLLFQNNKHLFCLTFHQFIELIDGLRVQVTCLFNDQRSASQTIDNGIEILVVQFLSVDNCNTAFFKISVLLQCLDNINSQHCLAGAFVTDDQQVACAGRAVTIRALRVIFQNRHDLLAHTLNRYEVREQFFLLLCQACLQSYFALGLQVITALHDKTGVKCHAAIGMAHALIDFFLYFECSGIIE